VDVAEVGEGVRLLVEVAEGVEEDAGALLAGQSFIVLACSANDCSIVPRGAQQSDLLDPMGLNGLCLAFLARVLSAVDRPDPRFGLLQEPVGKGGVAQLDREHGAHERGERVERCRRRC
jgi:hypothetical protein